MLSRKLFLVLAVCLFFISNISMADMCARLSEVSAGEDHTLALMDDDTLWACGSNDMWQLGLGSDVTGSIPSLKQVLGENGVGFLENIEGFYLGFGEFVDNGKRSCFFVAFYLIGGYNYRSM